MKKILLTVTLFSLGACVISDYRELSSVGEDAIHLCLAEYVKLKGDTFPREIDRAYVYAGTYERQDIIGILFTRGEMGTFGNRAKNYQSFISCDILLEPKMRVSDLREGYSVLKTIGMNMDESVFFKGHVDELLYLRNDMKFSFKKAQVFSSERIDSLQFPTEP